MSQVLRAVQGATFTEPVTLTDRDGAPIDLTGATITFMAKERVDDLDLDAVLSASTAGGTITIVDAPTGAIRFAIPPATTDTLDPSRVYAWTLQVVISGQVMRFPDDFQDGPGKLLVAASAITAVPT